MSVNTVAESARAGVPFIYSSLHSDESLSGSCKYGLFQKSKDLSRELFQEYEKMNYLQPYEKAYILLSDQDEIISGNPERCRKLTPHVKMTSGDHSTIDDLKGELGVLLKELEASEPANG